MHWCIDDGEFERDRATGGSLTEAYFTHPATSSQLGGSARCRCLRVSKSNRRASSIVTYSKLDHIARFELAQAVEIGGDDVGDVRVTPHGPAGDTEDDQLPAGDLDGTGRNRRREPLGIGGDGDGITLKPQAFPIVPRSDPKLPACPECGVQLGIRSGVGAGDDPEWRGRSGLPRRIGQVARKNARRCGRKLLARSQRLLRRAAAENGRRLPASAYGEVRPGARGRMTQHELFAVPKREARRNSQADAPIGRY